MQQFEAVSAERATRVPALKSRWSVGETSAMSRQVTLLLCCLSSVAAAVSTFHSLIPPLSCPAWSRIAHVPCTASHERQEGAVRIKALLSKEHKIVATTAPAPVKPSTSRKTSLSLRKELSAAAVQRMHQHHTWLGR